MKITHIEHIGIAVRNLNESIKFYEEIFGLKCYSVEDFKNQNVKTAFFKIGMTKIELLESTDIESPVGKFIEKRGEGIHHIAFAVNNLDNSLVELKERNIKLIDDASQRGAEGFNIAFIHPKSAFGVLTELCEMPR